MQAAQFQTNFETEQVHWWFAARRNILGSLVRHLVPPSHEQLVVDVGCGTGGNLNSFSHDYSCLGADPTPEAIALARLQFPHLELICGEAPEALGEQARRASVYLMTDVLEHVQRDAELLRRVVEYARPGAFFVLTVPAHMSLWSPHDVSHGHYRRYTRQEFAALWQGLPVHQLMLSHYNTRLFFVIKAVRLLNRLRDRSSGRAGTDIYVPTPWLNRFLTWLFQGERDRLLRMLRGRTTSSYPFGVSLLAVLRKT